MGIIAAAFAINLPPFATIPLFRKDNDYVVDEEIELAAYSDEFYKEGWQLFVIPYLNYQIYIVISEEPSIDNIEFADALSLATSFQEGATICEEDFPNLELDDA